MNCHARETLALPQPSLTSLHLPTPEHNQKGRGQGRRVFLELPSEVSKRKMGPVRKGTVMAATVGQGEEVTAF